MFYIVYLLVEYRPVNAHVYMIYFFTFVVFLMCFSVIFLKIVDVIFFFKNCCLGFFFPDFKTYYELMQYLYKII